jgi:hypothetical protein
VQCTIISAVICNDNVGRHYPKVCIVERTHNVHYINFLEVFGLTLAIALEAFLKSYLTLVEKENSI